MKLTIKQKIEVFKANLKYAVKHMRQQKFYLFEHFICYFYFAFYWWSYFTIDDEFRIFHPFTIIKKFELNYFTRALSNIIDAFMMPDYTWEEYSILFFWVSIFYSLIMLIYNFIERNIKSDETVEKMTNIRDKINNYVFLFSTICLVIVCIFAIINALFIIYYLILRL
jgi:hypothetical protein